MGVVSNTLELWTVGALICTGDSRGACEVASSPMGSILTFTIDWLGKSFASAIPFSGVPFPSRLVDAILGVSGTAACLFEGPKEYNSEGGQRRRTA